MICLHPLISIHAFPRKNATTRSALKYATSHISIHAFPRKNATYVGEFLRWLGRIFQSTHSLARMRLEARNVLYPPYHFNPRIPSQECDMTRSGRPRLTEPFQSTHSLARMRRTYTFRRYSDYHFNPRIPSQECDGLSTEDYTTAENFNPRTPSQECDRNHYQKSLLIPSISYPYCTPPLSKTQPLYFHRTIFSHKSPISQCESSYIFMFT